MFTFALFSLHKPADSSKCPARPQQLVDMSQLERQCKIFSFSYPNGPPSDLS